VDIKQAIEILDQVAANYKGTRREHAYLQQALDVIKEPIKKAPDDEKG